MTPEHGVPVWAWRDGEEEPTLAGHFDYLPPASSFRYTREFVDRGYALDPHELRLPVRSTLTHGVRALRTQNKGDDGLFGVFRDTCPEGYGRDLLQHQLGIDWGAYCSPMTLLENSTGDAVGAVEICHDIERKTAVRFPSVERLADAVRANPAWQRPSKAIHAVLGLGTSMGGERPKLTVARDDTLWLAKLQSVGDSPHMPAREYVGMQLAQRCGIAVAPTELHRHHQPILLVRRFDRPSGLRCRLPYLSAHTVMRFGNTPVRGDPRRSYLMLADRARMMGVPAADIAELWRRMVFNALIRNVDDHPKNHGFIRQQGTWRLSPAFDLVPIAPAEQQDPSTPPELAMAVAVGTSTATVEALLSSAPHFGIAVADAATDLLAMATLICQEWRDLSLSHDISMPYVEQTMAKTFQWCSDVAGKPDAVHAMGQALAADSLGRRRSGRRLTPSRGATTPR